MKMILRVCILGYLSISMGVSSLCAQTPGSESSKQKAEGKKKGKDASDGDDPAEAAPLVLPPIKIVRPTEVGEKSLNGKYRFYLGTTHAHSGYSGDHAKSVATKYNNGAANYQMHTPAEIFAKAKTNFYDFYFMTDHSSPEQNDFYKDGFTDEHWGMTKTQMEAATNERFVALRGYEFSRNHDPDGGGLGHMNVLNASAWASAYAKGHTFAWLYDWLRAKTNEIIVAQFNHPAMPGQRAKNFRNYEGRTKERNEVVRMVEIWNSGEGMHYVPVVRKIWALGWKVAPASGTDVHGPFGLENRRLRTGVLAEALTPDAVMRAMKARRVYASLEPTLHVDFALNDVTMGTALAKRPEGELTAKVMANDPAGAVISKVEIYGAKYDANGGGTETLATIPMSGEKVMTAKVRGGFDFYYAAVFKQGTETARAFTAPIWMDDE